MADLRARCGIELIETQIKRRHLRYIGHLIQPACPRLAGKAAAPQLAYARGGGTRSSQRQQNTEINEKT